MVLAATAFAEESTRSIVSQPGFDRTGRAPNLRMILVRVMEVRLKVWLLKLHRWVALAFALPLIFVIGSGLVLSFEPWLVDRNIAPGSLDAPRVLALMQQADPGAQARSLSYRSYDGTLTLSAGRGAGGGGTTIDVATGTVVAEPSALATLMGTARGIHERLLLDAGWLVTASTLAMVALILFGILMGVPRIRNTVAGWHKAIAWGLLPLVVLSPLTGLCLAWGITFAGGLGAGGPPAAVPSLTEAVQALGAEHDLSGLIFIRQQGSRLLARIDEGGEYKVYDVSKDGVALMPRNWPRLWHEGDFAGAWSSLLNLVTSLALITLLGTGGWIWLRRNLRLRAARAQRIARA
jgi:uncharacterized iron-regulated membrane protein